MDLLIAAHAVSLDVRLITHNVKEFGKVRGLRIEDWSREIAGARDAFELYISQFVLDEASGIMKPSDPIVDEVRSAREALARQSDDNIEKIAQAARARQAQGRRKVVSLGRPPSRCSRCSGNTTAEARVVGTTRASARQVEVSSLAQPGPQWFFWRALEIGPPQRTVDLPRCGARLAGIRIVGDRRPQHEVVFGYEAS
jgi:hypothetical protein